MKKIVRLTENDLTTIVKKVIKEQGGLSKGFRTATTLAAAAAIVTVFVATNQTYVTDINGEERMAVDGEEFTGKIIKMTPGGGGYDNDRRTHSPEYMDITIMTDKGDKIDFRYYEAYHNLDYGDTIKIKVVSAYHFLDDVQIQYD